MVAHHLPKKARGGGCGFDPRRWYLVNLFELLSNPLQGVWKVPFSSSLRIEARILAGEESPGTQTRQENPD